MTYEDIEMAARKKLDINFKRSLTAEKEQK